MTSVLLLYNQPSLAQDHPNYASEAGVLEAVDAVERSLRELKLQVNRLAVGRSLLELADKLRALRPPDVVFNLCEGLAGVGEGESQVAGVIELLAWPLTGNSSQCLSLVRDKPRTKWLLRGANLPTAEFQVIRIGQSADRQALYDLINLGPLIVKPAAEDASLGVGPESVVTDRSGLERQIAAVADSYGDVLIERFIAGREFNVGVIALPTLETLPLAEILFDRPEPSRQMVTYDAKWTTESEDYRETPVCCPADVDEALACKLRSIAQAAFRVCGCRGYARVDFRVDATGQPYVLEVNANPDISATAGLSHALAVAGIGYTQFIERVIEEALLRAHPGQATDAHRDRAGQISQDPVELRSIKTADLDPLVIILERCNVFREDEIKVGREVLESAIQQSPGGDYRVVVAELEGTPIGWACYGLVPLTDATYDLYWIAVDPRSQSSGVGRSLIQRVQAELRAAGARWLLAETSAARQYDPTRQFYLRTGFELLSSIPDFYRAGDGRMIFGLRID